MNKRQPLVSVIIPTKNSAQFLEKCLKSIKNQTYNNIEIIVVDNNSIDKTKEIARKYTKKVYNKGPERTYQKNYGIKKSKGDYLFFVDSDMELDKKVVFECVNKIKEDSKIGGICISERSLGNSFWVKVRDYERGFYLNTDIESARFFPSKLIKKVGGFDEGLIFFEEATLPKKIENLNFNVHAHINSVIFHHEENFNLIDWLKKKKYYGKTMKVYKDKFPEDSKNKSSLLYRFKLYLSDRRFYSKTLLAFGVIILKFLEYLFAGLGYIFG